jgi:hypothetical protein
MGTPYFAEVFCQLEHVKQFPSQDVRREPARMCWAGNGNSSDAVVHNAIPHYVGGKYSGIQSQAGRNLSLFSPLLSSYRFIKVHELESIL